MVVAHGGLKPKAGVNRVKLANYSIFLPKGTRLRVTVGAPSPAGQFAYLGFPGSGSATIGPVSLTALRRSRRRSGMKRLALLSRSWWPRPRARPRAPTPGSTPKRILSAAPSLSGEASAFGSSAPVKAYFDYVNATAGGVNSREKIEYRYYNDAYNPVQTRSS